jgi:o-succinylbenzoate synthase
MRICRPRLQPFRLTLRRPHRTAHGSVRIRRGYLVELRDGEGRIGRGEATPFPAAGTEELSVCRHALNRVIENLVRRTIPSNLAQLDHLLGSLETLRDRPAARFAIELALLDLIAQRRKLPLARLLRPDAALRIRASALLSDASPAELGLEARRLSQRGFRVFKIKVGTRPPAQDRARVAAVRAAAGRAVLRLDANGAFGGVRAALAALAQFEEFRIELCEEPLTAGTPDAFARLRAASPIPIAADESLALRRNALALVRRRAVDVLVLKPMALGGLLSALQLARRAESVGIASLVTTTLDGVIARLGAAHLAAALPPSGLASGLATGALLASDSGPDPSRIRLGWLQLSRRPGLGLASWGDR